MIVYPRLESRRALELHIKLQEGGLEKLIGSRTEDDVRGWWNPTAGREATPEEVRSLTESIIECRESIDGLHAMESREWKRTLDRDLAILFASDARWNNVLRSQLIDRRFWAWFSLVGEPETATLRFDPASWKRFGVHIRNVYFRCWQRGQALRDTQNVDDPWHLLALKEDQMVAIFERPGLAASPDLARSIARAAIGWTAHSDCEDITRLALKRLMAWNAPRCLELLSPSTLEFECRRAFEEAAAVHGD